MGGPLDPSYTICIVKRNENQRVRLCEVNSLLELHYTGKAHRIEIDIIGGEKEDFSNELLQKGSMIWFSPTNPKIIEATAEDDRAHEEDAILKKMIDEVEDVDPHLEQDNVTLIQMFCSEGVFSLSEGQMRKHIQDLRRGHSN